jgi:Xaa-Pro aminopeptidase
LTYDGYHADMARTDAVGQPAPDVVELASSVRASQDAALAA